MLQQYNNVLVAMDGSYESEMALQKAIEIVKRNNSTLHILHVIDTRAFQDVSSFDSSMVEQVTSTSRKALEEYVEQIKVQGVSKIVTKIEYGAPKLTIASDYPKRNKIDLIMLGATGLNAVERLLIGSVTEFVTRNAPCDVLVVRTDNEGHPLQKQPKTKDKK
ncbi:universal stress protein [Lactobacillus sp. DCY120]|uniref:Universal stress protein n=1 Tax=Bombilactobacillus apium TaxID=2675299 RepID=A0A850R0V1_9LACO|nr:universal stress protein [Bombilactobacillus apium]NVY95651.1 universal stress protein [Bombilactobacillus apium]